MQSLSNWLFAAKHVLTFRKSLFLLAALASAGSFGALPNSAIAQAQNADQGAPTADEAKQLQSMIAERDQLQKRANTGMATAADQAKLNVLQKEIDRGRPFTREDAKAQSLIAERDVRENRVKSGRAR